jgi:prepilin-type N-terminal cleavage/methylation domain-containing protein
LKRFVARSARGFTLVEIAVVLVIIGLITAGILALFTSVLKSSKSRVAAENATVVQQALERFIERYGRLPCPAVPTAAPGAANYGVEDTVVALPGASCPNVAVGATGMARGVVPWISLGLPLDQVQDGYAHMFTYNATIAATQTNASNVSATRGNMTIHTATPTVTGMNAPGNQINSCWIGAAPAPAGENSCNMNALVVLISHGENGFGAFTSTGGQVTAPTSAAEIENTNADVAFVKGDPTAAGFDDVVFAWSPDDLLEPLARQGTVKSATATTLETLRSSAIAISNSMVNGTVAPNLYAIPAASPVALPADAWGNAVVYTALNAGNQMCPTMPAGTTVPAVFTLASPGIDGVPGLNANTGRNDDLSISVTVDPLRNQINNRAGFAC